MPSDPPLELPAGPADPVADQPDDEQLVRDTEFWLEGGSVVLVAGNVMLKVYRETLAVPSVVFQGLFQFPRNVAMLTLDGCPIVKLSDSPEDLRHLLRVLFQRPTPMTGTAKIPFPHVSACVRLAHKYKMSTICDNALKVLTDYYNPKYNLWVCRDHGPLQVLPIHAIDAIHIARLTGTDLILPLAFLDCARHANGLAYGYGREDGTRIFLAPEDLARALRLRDELRNIDAGAIRHLGAHLATCGTTDACVRRDSCREEACVAWPVALSRQAGGDPLIFRAWDQTVNEVFRGLCAPCRAGLARRDPLSELRSQVWERLPQSLSIQVPVWMIASRGSGGSRIRFQVRGTILSSSAY